MNIPSIWNLFVIQLLNMLISMLVSSLACNGFEMNEYLFWRNHFQDLGINLLEIVNALLGCNQIYSIDA